MDQYMTQREFLRFMKKIKRAAEKGIVFGIPDQSVSVLSLGMPINTLLLHPKGKNILIADIARQIMPKLTDGKMFLNTNIPEDVLKGAGLKR